MSTQPHKPGCTCEHCWAERYGSGPPTEDPLSTSRAELLAALDRAFNAGVDAERQRAARERAGSKERKR